MREKTIYEKIAEKYNTTPEKFTPLKMEKSRP